MLTKLNFPKQKYRKKTVYSPPDLANNISVGI